MTSVPDGADPPGTGLRAKQKEQTIGLIIDAFSELSISHPRFTMQELADAAGISVRTLYRYFRNREELDTGLLDVITERLGPDHTTHLEEMTSGTEAMVRHSFDVFSQHDKLMRAVVCARLSGTLTDPSHQDRAEQILSGTNRTLGDPPDAVKRQLAGLLRLVGGSVSWMTLTDGTIELTSEEAGDAAAWALRVLTTAARDAGEYLE